MTKDSQDDDKRDEELVLQSPVPSDTFRGHLPSAIGSL